MVIEYDNKTLMPLLVIAFQFWISTLMVLLNQHQFMTITIPFLGSDFKWSHFARVVEKSIVFIPPHICEAWRFCVTLDLLKPHEAQFPNIFFVVWQIFKIFQVPNKNKNNLKHSLNVVKHVVLWVRRWQFG